MHLIRYLDRGAARLGAVSGDVVVDVVRACAQAGIAAPDDVLSAAADPACADAIDEAQRERSNAIVETEERDLELAVPIGRPGKILALAANYPSHAEEVGEAVRDKSRSIPHVFPKLPSTLVGPGAPIVIPRNLRCGRLRGRDCRRRRLPGRIRRRRNRARPRRRLDDLQRHLGSARVLPPSPRGPRRGWILGLPLRQVVRGLRDRRAASGHTRRAARPQPPRLLRARRDRRPWIRLAAMASSWNPSAAINT